MDGTTVRDGGHIFEISAESTARPSSGMAGPLLSGNAQFNNCVQLFFHRPVLWLAIWDGRAAALCRHLSPIRHIGGAHSNDRRTLISGADDSNVSRIASYIVHTTMWDTCSDVTFAANPWRSASKTRRNWLDNGVELGKGSSTTNMETCHFSAELSRWFGIISGARGKRVASSGISLGFWQTSFYGLLARGNIEFIVIGSAVDIGFMLVQGWKFIIISSVFVILNNTEFQIFC